MTLDNTVINFDVRNDNMIDLSFKSSCSNFFNLNMRPRYTSEFCTNFLNSITSIGTLCLLVIVIEAKIRKNTFKLFKWRFSNATFRSDAERFGTYPIYHLDHFSHANFIIRLCKA